MKDATKTKQHLEWALRVIPTDNVYTSVRSQIQRVINEIGHIEKKRERRAEVQKTTPAGQWKLDLEKGALTNPNAWVNPIEALTQINDMIKSETDKLNAAIASQQAQPNTPPRMITG